MILFLTVLIETEETNMPKELVAVAPRQPVLREYEEGPHPRRQHPGSSRIRSTQTRHRTDGILRIQQRKFSTRTWEYVRRKNR